MKKFYFQDQDFGCGFQRCEELKGLYKSSKNKNSIIVTRFNEYDEKDAAYQIKKVGKDLIWERLYA